ncbi:MAG TPA: DNA mismatch repair protein MutS [Polyangiaceae bacterium]
MSARETPVMKQHAAAKRAYPDAILFFRLGDFYEMFGEDAVVSARELELTLTSRNKGKADEVPMAGVPHHAAHGYIARLLEKGYKIAICEQMADPSTVKGIVPREVVRVITPGTVTEGDQLEPRLNNWLCSVHLDAQGGVGLALLDVSTAELRAAELTNSTAVLAELSHAAPREVLVGPAGGDADARREAATSLLSVLGQALPAAAMREDGELTASEAAAVLGDLSLDAERLGPNARLAVARVLRFARACNPSRPPPVRRVAHWDPTGFLVIDRTAQVHLELLRTQSGDKTGSLLDAIDRTLTPAGARLLRRRLVAPALDVERIRRRLDRVELFLVHSRTRDEFRAAAKGVNDLERLAVRACLNEATPRDLGALRDGLAAASRAVDVLSAMDDPAWRDALVLNEPVDSVDELRARLEQALVDRPPAQSKEGAVFKADYDSELCELDQLKQHGTERVVEYEAEARAATGIQSLKVRYTRVFGWYIEVSRGQASKVPGGWRRKQTVATGERYTTDALDELAHAIENAEGRHRERELELLVELVAYVAERADRIRQLAERIAHWDVDAAFAELAHTCDYCKPEVDDSDTLRIVEGRHPVVERMAAAGRFVPNDVELTCSGERLWLVTGPNMAGKSTLLRQVALTAILAQTGSYVPAQSARIGVVDRVLSRVGASDNLAGGESTFMVEMRETAEILRNASPRSLVILDEIGRGTSTFDGLAIAWAVAEHLDDVVKCRALFATHYHELTKLGEQSAHVANYCVSARELDEAIIFLHRLVRGAASRSYGVFVAQLAGLPESVLARARGLLASLEAGQHLAPQSGPRGKRRDTTQLDLFVAPPANAVHEDVANHIRALDLDRLTGLEALSLLARFKDKLAKT